MFDHKVTHIDASGPKRIDVHEHRAPTDASARLLKELEEKAIETVIHSQPIEVAGVKGSITHFYDPMGGSQLHISFAINNQGRRDIRVKLKESLALDFQDYATYVGREIAIAIAEELITGCDDVRRLMESRWR